MTPPPARRTAATLSALALAATLVLTTSHGAGAGGLLTGKDIKNSTITGKDVKDGSLAVGDFKAGQLPAGATGPAGAPGAPGKDLAPPTVVSWTGTSPANTDPYRAAMSTMSIPAGSTVSGVSLTTTDLALACPGGFGAYLYADDELGTDYYDYKTVSISRFFTSNPSNTSSSYRTIGTGPRPRMLRLAFKCLNAGLNRIAMPAISFVATFAYSVAPAPSVAWSGSTTVSDD